MIPWLHNFTAKRCIAGLFLLNSTMAAPIDGVLLEVIAPSLWVCACSAGGQEFLTHHVHHRTQGTPVPGDLSARNVAGYPAICRIGVVADRELWPICVLARQDTEEARWRLGAPRMAGPVLHEPSETAFLYHCGKKCWNCAIESFLNRNDDDEPGVRTIWRGLR
jgi:hypothetical protein